MLATSSRVALSLGGQMGTHMSAAALVRLQSMAASSLVRQTGSQAVRASPLVVGRVRTASTGVLGGEHSGRGEMLKDSEGHEHQLHRSSPAAERAAERIAEGAADTPHFRKDALAHPLTGEVVEEQRQQKASYSLPHPIWDENSANTVSITHYKPLNITDRMAFASVSALRFVFDTASGYKFGLVDEKGWLNRVVFLETVAGVPGMVGAMVRHLNSLRRMERDYGWIHTLLEEAENERMHLMTALVLRKPGPIFRSTVLFAQGVFLAFFTCSYLLSPRFAHRFVGYLEEEAVKTYTHLIEEMDKGKLPLFTHMPAPPVARAYWQLGKKAMLRDVWLAIRADESHHREVNHTFAGMQRNDPNPFPPGH
ncbi:unnamed protein product [Vitrella brassicaformis CCMP3155]|uniref:Alternative oxidase n=1 Tax=Vitrella brassicaformis (strain CCMP3155) TaxID=1169540 RepID=A0A0G4FAZ2_VITBC|nr:unnamed protein product [Vitrella brassicaformis CCMP3155]|mmetsp:Transcript_1424/g.3084  ORF Transcript_1424/g.3084 Transcript_1424/m.3084 type:complete len:367 (-) Transcript_1424:554-1654(-)|eukprot:CEM10074.1 unnamed protein product [Vitrella brassicaformis CCMP3155]